MRGLLLALPLIAACTGKSSDDSADPDGVFMPDEGAWTVASESVVSDGCGLYTDSPPDSDAASLTHVSAGVFTLSIGGGEDSVAADITCTLEGQTASCPATTAFEVDYADAGLDGVLSLTFTISGAFSSATEATLVNQADLSCAGADCDQVEAGAGLPLPCTTTTELNVVHSG